MAQHLSMSEITDSKTQTLSLRELIYSVPLTHCYSDLGEYFFFFHS